MAEERKLLVGPALAEIVQIYRANAGVLLSLAAMIFLPLTLLTDIVSRESIASGMVVSLVFSGSAAFIYGGLVAPIALPRTPGGTDPTSIAGLWSQASPGFGHLLLAGLLYTLATTIGVFALIVPGLILITIWAAAPAVIRLEGAKPLRSLSRSRDLVRGNAWRVFGLLVSIIVLVLAVSVLLAALSVAVAGEDTGSFIGSWLGVVISAPLLGLMPTVLYRSLVKDEAEVP